MSDKKMTYWEAVVISWRNEWERGDPWRIIRLAFFTVYYSFVYYVFIYVPRMIARALMGDTDWTK